MTIFWRNLDYNDQLVIRFQLYQIIHFIINTETIAIKTYVILVLLSQAESQHDNIHLNPSICKVDAGGAGVKGILDWVPKPILGNSQISVIPVPKSPTPSSGLQVHKAHMDVCVCTCTGHTHEQEYKFLKSFKIYFSICIKMYTSAGTLRGSGLKLEFQTVVSHLMKLLRMNSSLLEEQYMLLNALAS